MTHEQMTAAIETAATNHPDGIRYAKGLLEKYLKTCDSKVAPNPNFLFDPCIQLAEATWGNFRETGGDQDWYKAFAAINDYFKGSNGMKKTSQHPNPSREFDALVTQDASDHGWN